MTVNGDTLCEPDETFFVNLSNPVNADIADGQGVGIIEDDDCVLPSLSMDDMTVVEGDSGMVDAVFTVNLSAASGQQVTVAYTTTNGTATAGEDYAVRVWRHDGTEVATLKVHQGPVRTLRFAPRGKLLVTGSDDTTLRLWPLSALRRSGAELRQQVLARFKWALQE